MEKQEINVIVHSSGFKKLHRSLKNVGNDLHTINSELKATCDLVKSITGGFNNRSVVSMNDLNKIKHFYSNDSKLSDKHDHRQD